MCLNVCVSRLKVCLQECVFVLRCVGVCEDVCIRTRKGGYVCAYESF